MGPPSTTVPYNRLTRYSIDSKRLSSRRHRLQAEILKAGALDHQNLCLWFINAVPGRPARRNFKKWYMNEYNNQINNANSCANLPLDPMSQKLLDAFSEFTIKMYEQALINYYNPLINSKETSNFL